MWILTRFSLRSALRLLHLQASDANETVFIESSACDGFKPKAALIVRAA